MSQSAYNLFAQLQDILRSGNETISLDTLLKSFEKIGTTLSTEELIFLKTFKDKIPIEYLLYRERIQPLSIDNHQEISLGHAKRDRNYYDSFYDVNRYGRIKQLPLTYQTLLPNLETNTVYAKNNHFQAALVDEYNTFSKIKEADDNRWQTVYNRIGADPRLTLNPKIPQIQAKEIDFQQTLFDNAVIEMFDIENISNLDGKSTLRLFPKDKTSVISNITIYNAFDNFKPTKSIITKRDGSIEQLDLPLADKMENIIIGQRKQKYQQIPSYNPASGLIPLYESNVLGLLNNNKLASQRQLNDEEALDMVRTKVTGQNNFVSEEDKGIRDLDQQQNLINTQKQMLHARAEMQNEMNERAADIRFKNAQIFNTYNFLKDKNRNLQDINQFIHLNRRYQDKALGEYLGSLLTETIQKEDPNYWYDYINENIPTLKYKSF